MVISILMLDFMPMPLLPSLLFLDLLPSAPLHGAISPLFHLLEFVGVCCIIGDVEPVSLALSSSSID